MTRRALPGRLLWIVDREALDREALPGALRGGVRWLYLRDPSVTAAEWRAMLAGSGGGLTAVVGTGPSWALEDGLGAHLKAAQPALEPTQRAAWPWLGRSVHDLSELRRAAADHPDYLIAGPVFPTTSKPGHPGIALVGLSAIASAASGCPVLAVGGIEPSRVAAVVGAGAAGIAVRSGLSAAGDPQQRARAYARALAAAGLPVDPD